MLITEMSRQDSIDLLVRLRVGRLACSHQGQPYITPLHWEYDDGYLYGFSTLGQKISWMRTNPLVCVEFEELASPQNWATVLVAGKYEELSDTPQDEELRGLAHDLFQKRPVWWEPGYVKTALSEKPRPMDFLYFRIRIDQISGHRGNPDMASSPISPAGRGSAAGQDLRDWLRKCIAAAFRSS
ncbi:MAG: pyridoxamine 5'-phosphate oxidase family protein [Dongiaceae bacterium]